VCVCELVSHRRRERRSSTCFTGTKVQILTRLGRLQRIRGARTTPQRRMKKTPKASQYLYSCTSKASKLRTFGRSGE
jgi:2-polyprenyl-6-methoxyphenol hydroxylase-like FAD-dependent oxidoreductase